MVTYSYTDVLNHQAKLSKSKPSPSGAAERETGKGGLHEQIMDYCNAQWPRWKFIHSRTDQKSTVAVGSHDFTIFLPGGRVECIEAKAKGGKLSSEQLAWAKELSMLGHQVHVVYNLGQFVELTK